MKLGEVIPSGAGGCMKELFWLPNYVVLDEGLDAESSNRCWLGIN